MDANIRIKSLTKEDLPIIKEIWKDCFNDSDNFLNIYFKDIVSPKSSFGLFENERLVSDLFMLPFSAKLADRNIETHFLAGCATIPEARNKDYMKALIKHTLKYFYAHGETVTYLHPFKHSFYRKFDYETIAFVNNYSVEKIRYTKNDNLFLTSDYVSAPLKKMRDIYNEKMKEFDNCFIRNEARFNGWIKLLCADGGKVAFLIDKENNLLCYALLYEKDSDSCDIFELIFASENHLNALVESLPYKIVNYFLPSCQNYKNPENEEFTMMRVINPIKALEQYPFQINDNFIIKINDEFLENEYNISVQFDENKKIVKETKEKADIEVDIGFLAQLLTGSYPEDIPNIEKQIFVRQNSCFFETY